MQVRDKDDIDRQPFEGIEKAAVVQECKAFHAADLDVQSVKYLLVKLQYLFAHGETVSGAEAEDLFFGTTKLFDNKDPTLRRLLFINLKDLAKHCEHALIAVNMLLKDINTTDTPPLRIHATRAIRKMTDAQTIGLTIDRYLKQAFLEKDDKVTCAALVTGLHLAKESPDLAKSWKAEVTETLQRRSKSVQSHALPLLAFIRKGGRLPLVKLVDTVQNEPITSPHAICSILKLCEDAIREDPAGAEELVKFAKLNLKNIEPMIVLQAARCLIALPQGRPEVLETASTLGNTLTSFSNVVVFATVRMIDRLVTAHPNLDLSSGPLKDLPNVCQDSNPDIASLAVTVLLKTGGESSIDRLVQDLNRSMEKMDETAKMGVVSSLGVLCKKYPKKSNTILRFLSKVLRDEGSLNLKRSAVESIITIVKEDEDAKPNGLIQLCEFIEDCEYAILAQRILHFLALTAPGCESPSRYIRHIYNRTLLEVPIVRAAAVSAMAKIAAKREDLRSNIKSLLTLSFNDQDDEVRDRAVFYHNVLEGGVEGEIEMFISDISVPTQMAQPKTADPAAVSSEAPAEQSSMEITQAGLTEALQEMNSVGEYSKLGEVVASCGPVALTDPDTEYVVSSWKHIFKDHVLFQFRVQNTLDCAVLDQVEVRMDAEMEGIEEASTRPAERIAEGEVGSCYVLFNRDPEVYPSGEAATVLTFVYKASEDGEVDEDGEEAEFQLEDMVLGVADHVLSYIPVNPGKEWDLFGELEQSSETFSFPDMKTLEKAAEEIIEVLGMSPLNGTNVVPASAKQHHTILLAGRLPTSDPMEKHKLMAKAKIFYSDEGGVALEFTMRGGDEEARAFISGALG